MKKTRAFLILISSSFFAVSCGGPATDPISSDDGSYPDFCEEDSRFFVFERDDTLENTIDLLTLGGQTEEKRDEILDLLGTNDGYANSVSYTLEEVVDYDEAGVLDDERDIFANYSKEVSRYDSEKILIGDYNLQENYYDEAESVEVDINLDADYQVFRNGYCPSLSRYYEIYDFVGTDSDVAIEKIYGTENYIRKLNLVNGQALALDFASNYTDYEDSELFSNLSFTAVKYASNSEGVAEGNTALNTSQSLKIELSGSYSPNDPALGESVSDSILIVDGMIKKVTYFSGTFEEVGGSEVYRSWQEKNIEYSVGDIGAYAGTLLDPSDFTFSTSVAKL